MLLRVGHLYGQSSARFGIILRDSVAELDKGLFNLWLQLGLEDDLEKVKKDCGYVVNGKVNMHRNFKEDIKKLKDMGLIVDTEEKDGLAKALTLMPVRNGVGIGYDCDSMRMVNNLGEFPLQDSEHYVWVMSNGRTEVSKMVPQLKDTLESEYHLDFEEMTASELKSKMRELTFNALRELIKVDAVVMN